MAEPNYRELLRTARAAVSDALEAAPHGCKGDLKHAEMVLKQACDDAVSQRRRPARRWPLEIRDRRMEP